LVVTMKDTLRQLLRDALDRCYQNGSLASGEVPAEIVVEVPANPEHGDFATNLAMILAKKEKTAPRKVAEALVQSLAGAEDVFARIEIAGPGFINFFLAPGCWYRVLDEIVRQGETFGHQTFGAGTRVQVEFVSANPTGPLHIGHGRGAATGDALARLLAACGYEVQREYYINDAGNQMQTLGRSILLRCRELRGEPVDFPPDCYQGDYIRDLAKEVLADQEDRLMSLPETEAVRFLTDFGGSRILAGIAADLEDFGVRFDNWYSEKSLWERDAIRKGIDWLREKGFVYEQDEALWFASTRFGDDKDRVMLRSNGVTTYFASDVAYHKEKFERGFDMVIDIWGADHHGYIPRMKAAVAALGRDREALQVILVQLVNLLRGGVPAAMSTRSGEFVTLHEVMDEVGSDACRYYFLSRHSDSKLDFDLELAKEQSSNNPVYYIQYAHARICSIRRKAAEEGVVQPQPGAVDFAALSLAEELGLVKLLSQFPELVAAAGRAFEPHRLTAYLQELATQFHGYYNRHRVVGEDAATTSARLYLVNCIQTVIANALAILGISAPERM
jgi:arginyl-tRNA synthetase